MKLMGFISSDLRPELKLSREQMKPCPFVYEQAAVQGHEQGSAPIQVCAIESPHVGLSYMLM